MSFSEEFLKELQELKNSGLSHDDICEQVKAALDGGEIVATTDGDDDNGSGGNPGSGPH
jgi:hypothetical protein